MAAAHGREQRPLSLAGASRLALYVPSGAFETVQNPFGKDTANNGLFRALARHGGFEELGVLTVAQASQTAVAAALWQGQPTSTRLRLSSILRSTAAQQAGALLRGSVDLAELAWMRNRSDSRGYSLIGLIHTIAPPAIREQIASLAIAPIQPWDALICTSPAVQTAIHRMFDDLNDYLGARFGGVVRPRPHLPLIPLGVDLTQIAGLADRPDIRRSTRNELGLRDDDVLVLWVGRLSFFEKAFPQPMFRAVEEAQTATGRRVHFVMLGWFPDGPTGLERYEEAARAHAPDLTLHILDGNDAGRVGAFWAAADIFLSLVDNIQETFGLTPLEAMAARLPVVASDWDGYRYTIRDGVEGFLIPTLGGPPGAGSLMSARHVLGFDAYQTYVGTVAQYTAVDIGRAAEAIADLVRSPDLRRRMGEAGRERVRTCFDWPVVARQIRNLVEDLATIRKETAPFGTASATRPQPNPAKGDPFSDFEEFATASLGGGTLLFLRRPDRLEQTLADLVAGRSIRLDAFAAAWRASSDECLPLLRRLAAGPLRLDELLASVPPDRHTPVSLALVWMCKLGMLGWRDGGAIPPTRAD